jgi:hypothetical protein
MIIYLSPQRRKGKLSLEKSGEVLTVNGEEYDFSPVEEGDILPREAVGCEFLEHDVTRKNGALQIHLIFPHGKDAPYEARFPTPIENPKDGIIRLPEGGIQDD